jgi:hypothetical protein
MYSEIIGSGLSVLNRAGDLLRRGGVSDSLVDFTSVGRVEPLVLIDQPAMHLDCIGEVQQSVLSIFAGYYLQAASLSNALGHVRVLDRLDTLNPNRNPVNAGLSTWMIATEAYENGLPFPGNDKLRLSVESGMGSLGGTPVKPPVGLGSATGASGSGSGSGSGSHTNQNKPSKSGNNNSGSGSGIMNDQPEDGSNFGSSGGNRGGHGEVKSVMSKADIGRTMTELANLSVGKAYEINLTDGQHTVPVQVNIRLIASMLPTPDLIHILATGSEDNSFKERWHGWKSGRLQFWKDLVLCNDLIDKHRTDLMKDKTGTLTNISRTNLNNSLSSLVSGSPTIASSSNIVVLTKDTAEQLELQLEGKLTKFDIRQRLMKKTSLMLMVVVDEVDYNTVTIYHRNIAMPTTVRIKDLKASNKGDGPAIADIMKALMGGHAPAL